MRDQLRSLEENVWMDYKRVLRRRNQPIYDELFDQARRHADAIGMANPTSPMEGVFLSICLEQQRAIQELEEDMEELKDEIGVNAGRIESLEHRPEKSLEAMAEVWEQESAEAERDSA